MALGKGIPVINGFDLNSKLPLDSRTVADTKENMNKLVTDGSVGDGQLCYCKADKKLYVLKEGAWSEVGGGEMIDLNEQIDLDNNTITQSGYNLIQQAYENNTLLGISFTLFGLVPIKCMFDYVDIDLETTANIYCFKFGVGETTVLKIKSDLTIIQSPQDSFGGISSFETAGYNGTFAKSFVSENQTYKIPYTLIYPSQDTYKNERLEFRNDTYNKTIYNIPLLPADASTKNYALNSVNGALTWNTIGNGLEIKDGALQEKVLNVSFTSILTDATKIQAILTAMQSIPTSKTHTGVLLDVNIPFSEFQDCDKIILDLSGLSSLGLDIGGELIFIKGLNTNNSGKAFYLNYMTGVPDNFSIVTAVLESASGENVLDRLVIEHSGTNQTTLDIDTTLTIPTSYFQLGVANDNKAILMTNENATTLVNEISSLPISELLKYDKFSVKLSLNSNIMKATFRKKYNVIGSDGNINTTNYNIELTFLLLESLYNIEMELQFWNTKNTFNANYSWCKVHIVDKL